jgi:transcriptional regulator with PAS, ATPase and Fis domain
MERARAAGAIDVLFSPPDLEEIRAEIEATDQSAVTLDLIYQDSFRKLRRQSLIGESLAFRKCLNELRLATKCDANVLLIGETGTGKEMFAQTIHQLSRRAGNSLMAINCAGLPGTLLETELFGHVKGSFTGAETSRIGRFEAVGAGTLLLDEIGDIEQALQVKLLRVIEQRVFQRVGDNKDVPFSARLICATSVNLEKAVAVGTFRRDLLGRIDQFRIELPSLRERRDDISGLVGHFLRKHAKGRVIEISKTSLEILEAYDYPMNVRQLENIIIGALARSDPGRLLLPRHLPKEIMTASERQPAAGTRPLSLPTDLTYKEAREYAAQAVDRLYLNELIKKHNGNYSKAAEEAGIDRKTFSARVEQALSKPEDDFGV